MMEQLNLTFWAWVESVRGMGRKEVWSPFVVLLLVQGLALLAILQFHRPGLSWVVAPFIEAVTREAALHYPNLYIALPVILGQINLGLDLLVGSYLFGVAYLIIWRSIGGGGEGEGEREGAWGRAGRAYPKLLLLRLPVLALLLLVYYGLPSLISGEPDGTTVRALRYGTFLLGVIAESFFIYAPLALLAGGRGVAGAFRTSIALAARMPLATFLLVLVPNLPQLAVAAAQRRSGQFVQNLAPEIMIWITLGGVVVYLLVNYFVLAAAARVFAARADRAEGGRAWAA